MRESIICLSHPRWSFIYQRPQQLLTRCAREHRVVVFEEPMHDSEKPYLERRAADAVTVLVPHLPVNLRPDICELVQRAMMYDVVRELGGSPVLWYYTPLALAFTHHVRARAVVYDCTNELSMFVGAPPRLVERERQLFEQADVVFTARHSLFEHKRATLGHRNLHAFPSSIDAPHFARARDGLDDPADQANIPHPRVGYFGVIDAQIDYALIAELAHLRPDVQIVMVGPLAKIDPAALPRRANLHWLGARPYADLPAYLAGWDVAFLPFARDDARFISPTRAAEYLAAGCPVVSTSIRDVVKPYGIRGLAWIADSAAEMALAIDRARISNRRARLARADGFLAGLSWDRTWAAMWSLVEEAIATRARRTPAIVQVLAKEH